MKSFFAFGAAMFLCLNLLTMSSDKLQACLPEGMKLADVVSVQALKPGAGDGAVKKITINDKLTELKARCKKGKLMDGSGREIRFVRLAGCWGNPPADYLEILERQQNEIAELKKRYAVIEISCDTSMPTKLIH